MRVLSCFFVAVLFLGCAQDQQSALELLEQEVEEQPTNTNVSQLLTQYSNWLAENQEATEERKSYLLKTYAVSDQHIRLSTKLNALQALVMGYYDDAETPVRLIEMSEIFETMRKERAAVVLKQAILSRWPTIDEAESLRTSLPPDAPPVDSAIAILGREMFSDEQFRLNEAIARQYVDACEAYALVNRDDPVSAEYLHKAAETARTLRTIPKALAIYDWILNRFPTHERAPQALFLKAFTYDNNLRDSANASRYYAEFLEKYPNDDFAESARFLLENLGKDDDELLEVLQQKAEENQ